MGKKRFYQVVICGVRDRKTGIVTYDRVKIVAFNDNDIISSANDPDRLQVLSPNHDVYFDQKDNLSYTARLCIKNRRSNQIASVPVAFNQYDTQWKTVSSQISPTQDMVCRAAICYFDNDNEQEKLQVLNSAGLGTPTLACEQNQPSI